MRQRVANWPELLSGFLSERRSQPFAWGSNDCALFAADWVLLCTGFDPAAEYRGRYTTAKGAVRQLKRLGDGCLLSSWDARVGGRVPVLMAQRGDVVAADVGERDVAMGVVASGGVYAVGPAGLVRMAITDERLVGAWRI